MQSSAGSLSDAQAAGWTDRAIADLEEIGEYIALDDPVAAERWVEVLLATAHRAEELPFSGRIVPELGRDDVREVLKRSYRIIYRILADRVEVLVSLRTEIDRIDAHLEEADPRRGWTGHARRSSSHRMPCALTLASTDQPCSPRQPLG